MVETTAEMYDAMLIVLNSGKYKEEIYFMHLNISLSFSANFSAILNRKKLTLKLNNSCD